MYAGIAAGLTLLAVSTYVIFLSIDQQKESVTALKEESKVIENKAKQDQQAIATDSLIAQSDPTTATEIGNAEPSSQRETEANRISRERRTVPQAHRRQQPSQNTTDDDIPALALEEQEPVQEPVDDNSNEPNLDLQSQSAPIRESEGVADNSRTDKTEHEADRTVTFGEKNRIAKRKIEPSKGESQFANGDISKSLEARFVRGKVVSSSDGTAIPGVNVVVKGTSQGTVTDAAGNYEIKIHPEQSLMFDFIGYKSEEVPVKDGSQEVNVKMTEDVQALSEVVVTGYGTLSLEEPEVFEMAEPEGGRKAFKKYLEDKMQYPPEAIEHKVEGKVTVQFTVDTDGSVTDFRILKGLGFGCDQELIRLIKEGPRWKPSKKNNQPVKEDVKVRLKFDLPE